MRRACVFTLIIIILIFVKVQQSWNVWNLSTCMLVCTLVLWLFRNSKSYRINIVSKIDMRNKTFIDTYINRFWYKDDLGKEACHITERRLLMCVSNLGNEISRVDNNDEEDDWCHCCFVIGSLRFWDDGTLFTPHPTRRSLELCGVTIGRTYFFVANI